MSEALYACTHVEKTSSSWHPTDGAGTRFTTIICESRNIQAASLPELIKMVGEAYFLDLDNLWLPDQEENGQITEFGYNRVETNDCDEPDEKELEQWEAGELKLYLCDYRFAIEKRVVSPIPKEEFDLAAIKTYE